jgi:hypothetical protein
MIYTRDDQTAADRMAVLCWALTIVIGAALLAFCGGD